MGPCPWRWSPCLPSPLPFPAGSGAGPKSQWGRHSGPVGPVSGALPSPFPAARGGWVVFRPVSPDVVRPTAVTKALRTRGLCFQTSLAEAHDTCNSPATCCPSCRRQGSSSRVRGACPPLALPGLPERSLRADLLPGLLRRGSRRGEAPSTVWIANSRAGSSDRGVATAEVPTAGRHASWM